MKRLVQLDPVSKSFVEVDQKKMQRTARLLRTYLLGLDPMRDTYRIREQVLPIVDAALDGSLKVPISPLDMPLRWELTEGLLPREYSRIAAPFFNTIMGSHRTVPQIVEKDGKLYAMMEFED